MTPEEEPFVPPLPEIPEVCPRCHLFRSCICPPPPDAPENAKRAHEAYLRAVEAIERGQGRPGATR